VFNRGRGRWEILSLNTGDDVKSNSFCQGKREEKMSQLHGPLKEIGEYGWSQQIQEFMKWKKIK
jgi:hypothetical protein